MEKDKKLALLKDFRSIRENVAFHFTSQRNIESILNEGLRPLIGDNASGGLGQSAIEKTYVSYGLEGVLQLYNRLISASFQQRIGDFNGISHKPFVPDSAKDKDSKDSLSIIEGFEMIRQYMEDNVYFIFDATKTQYEYSISDEDLEMVNSSIKDLNDSGINIVEKFEELDDKIKDLVRQDSEGNKEKILRLVDERDRLSLVVREKTLPIIDRLRGPLLNEEDNPIMEEIDYNDERLVWVNQMKAPHNTHTRIIDENGKTQGVRITKDMLRLFSRDGKTQSNGLDFLESMLSQVNSNDKVYLDTSRCRDCNLLFKFQEYIQLVKKYKLSGLLVTKPEETIEIGSKKRTIPERQVMDLTNIEKYPELPEFIEELEQYYEKHRYKKTTRTLAEEAFDKIKDSQAKKDVEYQISKDEQSLENTNEISTK